MPHFVVEYLDGPDAAGPRERLRGEHIAYRKGLGPSLVMAGPLFEDFDGSSAKGSLVIIEAEDKAEAVRIAGADPYAQAGVFEQIRVLAYRIAALNPPGKGA
jgi:uncharacterized protein YciI